MSNVSENVGNHPQYMDDGIWQAILPWVICGIGALFYSYEYLLRISPSVMTAEFMTFYQINAATFGGLTAVYYSAYTPMQLAVGLLMDWYGPRRLLTMACMLCVVGAYWFGGSTRILLAGIGRFFVGFGSAFAFVGVLTLATIWLPANRLALFTGMAAALGTLGAVAGNLVMTKMVSRLGWQQTIFISSYVGIAIVALIWLIIRDQPRSKLSAECRKHASKHESLEDSFNDFLKILKNSQIWINGAISCLLYLPTTVFAELWGKTYLEQVYGLTPDEGSYAIATLFFGFAIGAPLSGYISDSIKLRRLPVLIGSIASFFLFLILIIPDKLSLTTIYCTLFCLGLMYSTHVINFAIGRELGPKNSAGSSIAVTNMIVMLGGFVFQPLVGVLLDYSVRSSSTGGALVYSAADFKMALSIIPIGIFISIILCFFLKETHCQIQEE